MSATQSIQQEEIELRTAAPTPSASKTFHCSEATPAPTPTHLQSTDRPSAGTPSESLANPARGSNDEPADRAVEIAPEGGYGWVVVAACSVAMYVF